MRSITGTPSQALTPAAYAYTVTDSNGDTASAVFTVAVYNPVMLGDISDVGLTAGRQITAFTLPAASGGSGEYDYVVLDLPTGLEFNETSRTISGTPDAATVATVSYRAIDKVGNGAVLEPAVETYTITVTRQTGPGDDFVTTWRTTRDNERDDHSNGFVWDDYDYAVNWGDGTVTRGHTGDASHTYAVADDYEVRISGAFPRIYIRPNISGQRAINRRQPMGQSSLDFHGICLLRRDESSRFGKR